MAHLHARSTTWLLAALLSGCSREPVSAPAAAGPQPSLPADERDERDARGERDDPPGPAPAPAAEALAELEALGYVEWDEDAVEHTAGATCHDPGRTAPGYNLFEIAGIVYLTDLRGVEVHHWELPRQRKASFVEFLAGGSLLVGASRSLHLLDRDGKVLWQRSIPAHHDAAVREDGSFLVLTRRPEEFQGRSVVFDGVAHVGPDGTLRSEWSTLEHLRELHRHHPLTPLDYPPAEGEQVRAEETDGSDAEYDYYHTNSVEILPDTPLGRQDRRFRAGNLMLCLHRVNLVIVLDQDDYGVLWSYGLGILDRPHMPTMLESGEILVYDNGTRRGFTRILQVDPASGAITWSYQATPPEAFFSAFRGSNQRLANGNTLICEAERGHAFEVTADGEVVWEHWNPLVDGKRQTLYRFIRLAPGEVQSLLP